MDAITKFRDAISVAVQTLLKDVPVDPQPGLTLEVEVDGRAVLVKVTERRMYSLIVEVKWLKYLSKDQTRHRQETISDIWVVWP